MSIQLLEELKDSPQYGKRRDVISESSGKTYRVSVRKSDGRYCCSCPQWTRVCNKKGIDCKHITGVKSKFEGIGANTVAAVFETLRAIAALKSSDSGLSQWRQHKDRIELIGDYLDLTESPEHATFLTLFTGAKDRLRELLTA